MTKTDRIVYLSLRNACNAKCPMCLSWGSKTALPSALAAEVIRSVGADAWTRVVFTGGEVIEVPEFPELWQLTGSSGLRGGIVTNGTVFTRPYEHLLKAEHFDYLVYSRDLAGSGAHARLRGMEVYDAFLLQWLPELRDRGVYLQMNTVLFPNTGKELLEFLQTPYFQYFDRWLILPVKGAMAGTWTEGRKAQAAKALRELYDALGIGRLELVCPNPEDFATVPIGDLRAGHYTGALFGSGRYCLAQESLLYIDASGDVLPCNSILWEHRNEVSYGNVLLDSFDCILDRKRRHTEAKHLIDRNACRACDPLNVHRHDRAAALEGASDYVVHR